MRIADFHIDAFGRLADLSMTDVPAGLSIIVGENEAGKTTLLEFLRFILFGLPARKQKENPSRGQATVECPAWGLRSCSMKSRPSPTSR